MLKDLKNRENEGYYDMKSPILRLDYASFFGGVIKEVCETGLSKSRFTISSVEDEKFNEQLIVHY